MRARSACSPGGAASSAKARRASERSHSPRRAIHAAELLLDRRELPLLRRGGGALVARERAGVVPHERAQVADALVQAGGVGRAERQRRLEVLQRVGVGVQRRGVFRGEAVLLRGLRLLAGEAQVLSDEGRVLAARADSTCAAATRPCSSRRRARPVWS